MCLSSSSSRAFARAGQAALYPDRPLQAAAGPLFHLFCSMPAVPVSPPQVDALCPRRDGQRQHESRVVAQLLTLLDGAATGGGRAAGAGAAGASGRHGKEGGKDAGRSGVVRED